jgi:outer membrane protein OmpA-like peptidoglycan-associated protein
MAVDYILREGISKDRLSARGYGETRPLNHCLNGVSCSIEEHLYNQRLEVKILRMAGK